MTALNVAIAEDNPKTMELLNDMLKNEEGIKVVGNAKNGDEAYDMIIDSKPDVVLLDVIMPDMDGFILLRELKEEGIWVFGAAMEGSTPLYQADLKGPAAIVIGSEGEGMTRLAAENCDFLVSIPHAGGN